MNIAEQLEQNEKYDEAYAEYKKMLAKLCGGKFDGSIANA